jgi:hypothetical protein
MRDVMRIHGGDEALVADLGPKHRLVGKYSKQAPVVNPRAGDGIEFDEATQTFTLSEEILERLRNGE